MIKKIIWWGGLGILTVFIGLVIFRMPRAFNRQRTAEQVAKIHATKLTLDDVMGKNLPPNPGIEADKTVQGIDANQNGIRDDVELAIFKEYPNSAKTRAVLLQYALALQMEMIQTVVNRETVTAAAEDINRAYICVWSITSRDDMDKFTKETKNNEDFVKLRQFNTEQRKKAHKDFYMGNLGSYSSPDNSCDLDVAPPH